jgi:hypothetical protein
MKLTDTEMANLQAAGELHRCTQCGQLTVEKYSERRAVMDPNANGHFTIHPEARRVGDGEILGREECPSGQLGFGYR